MSTLKVESERITRARDYCRKVRAERGLYDRETAEIERDIAAASDPAERQTLADIATEIEELELERLNNTTRPGDPETELRAKHFAARVRRQILIDRSA